MKKIYFKKGKIHINADYKKSVKNTEKFVVITGLIIALMSWFLNCLSVLNILSIFIALTSFILVEFFVIFQEAHSERSIELDGKK